MLDKIGTQVEKHPYLIILLTILLTIAFAINIPGINMNTSTEDFMPDSEIANANSRVSDYFGKNQDVVMILTEQKSNENLLTPESIRSLHSLSQRLSETEDIEAVMSFTNFIEMICGMEYNTTIENSTNEQIQTVLQDILTDPTFEEKSLLQSNDPNEAYEYKRFPRLSKGRSFESADIKNVYIHQQDETITFTIEVYDLSSLQEQLTKPFFPLNVMEWSISFSNLIGPNALQDIDYRIAAHLEPKNELWTVGEGFFPNLQNIVSQIRNKELRNTFNTSVVLWISPPGLDTSFPIQLSSADLSFEEQNNKITWTVNKTELETYGIAPENDGFGMPARLGNFSTQFQYYQLPILHLPWLRVNTEMETLQNLVETMQHRPVLSKISDGMMSKFSSFSFEHFDDMETMLENNDNTINEISLTDVESWWITSDIAPDTDVSEETLFIKPSFLNDLKTSTLTFLPKQYEIEQSAEKTLLMAFINGSLSEEKRKNIVETLNQEINDLEPSSDFTLKTAGNTQLSIEIDEVAMESNKIIMPSIFIAILILLFITFRKASYMFLPLVGLSLSLLWVFGTMVLLGINFNMMYVALVPLMLGLGVDYAVHMFHNYRSELASGKTVSESIKLSIKEIGTALFLATITTVIAFLSFLTATIKPIQDLGLLSALGIIFTFIITLTFLQATRYLIDKKWMPKKPKSSKHSLEQWLKKLSILLIHHTKTVIGIAIVLSAVMGVAALQVETSFDMASMLPEDNPTVQIFDEIGKTFPFSGMDQEYVLIEGTVATTETLSGIKQTVENIQGNDYVAMNPNGEPKIVSVISIIYDAVEQNESLQTRFDLNQQHIPSSDRQVKEFYSYLLTHNQFKEDMSSVLHKNDDSYDATVIRVYTNGESQSEEAEEASGKGERLYTQLTEDSTNFDEVKVTVTGSETLMYVTAQSLTESQISSTMICIILAAIVLLIVFKNPMLSLLTLIPVLLSISWILGTMYFIGLDLNIMTVMITSITIGLGVTYAIHAVQRFRLIADTTGDIDKAVSSTVSHTGGALLASAATTVAGFGILMLAPITPQQQFGLISSITIIYSLLTTILILPPMLKVWAEWRKKHKGFIISKPKD
jgi:hydrophobe/amphiphile efflux-3 (HAE3) family protein